MLKIIKKSVKYFTIIAGIIILLPTILYLVIQIPEVQTLLVKRITNHFSAEIKSTISAGRIEFKFFNRLSINDILIKDKNEDTLLYSKNITAGIKKLGIKDKTFRLGRVILIKPVVQFLTDSTGQMNLTWYLDLLKSPSDTAQKTRSTISIDQIDLRDARFSLINKTGIPGKAKINFNDLNLSEINGIIEDLKIQNDTTSFNIYNLLFKEKSGFLVKKIKSSVILANQNIQLYQVNITSENSILNFAKIGLAADSSDSFKNFTSEVKLDFLLEKSLINSTDLGYFLPIPYGLNESVWLSGKIAGTISELRGRNIKLLYRDYTSLDCDFDFSGLPKIENAFMYVGVNSLNTNAKDLEKINIPGKGNIIVPEVLYKLGNVSFDGSFTGFTTDFVTYGKFRTSLGNFRTDISLRPDESNKYKIKGLLTANGIDLGELTGKADLFGKLSIQANVDGYAYSLKKFAANLSGKIDSIDINNYVYRNISLKGFFSEKTWDGSININDRNIKLDLLGMFNFKNKLPEFDFTLNLANANLYNLHFDKLDSSSNLKMLLTSNFKGNNIDNLDGEIKLLNSNFRKYNKDLELYDFSVRTYNENNKPVLSLRTDFVNADIRGYYNFAALSSLVKSTLSSLMPSQFPVGTKRNDLKKNNFTFEINFKNTDKINSFFRTGLLLADKSFIKGYIFPDSLISITGKAASMSIKGFLFNNLTLDAGLAGSELAVDIKSSNLFFLGKSDLKDFSIGLKTKPDNFIFTVNWDNKDINLNKGNFIAKGSIVKNPNGKRNSILRVEIDSTNIYSRNSLWEISHSSILIDSNAIKLNKLYIGSKDHYYLIDGAVSENPADTLHLEFKGIDISPLNYLGDQKTINDPNKIPLNVKGQLNGRILLSSVYKNLLLESDLIISNFSLLGSEYGNITVFSALDNVRKVVKINANNNLAGVKMFDVKGYYDPALKKIDVDANATSLPIEFLNPLLKVFASGITGLVSGKLNLSGRTDNLVLKGAVKAENAAMKIIYLQTTYKLNDTIRFDKKGIRFNNIRLIDEGGKTATLSGTVYHRNFKEYSADLTINMYTNDFLVLNTQLRDNSMFYGKVYASGVTKIKSGPNTLSFDISAKTGKNTKFFIPLNNGLSVSEYSFISFVDQKSINNEKTGNDTIKSNNSSAKLGMDINIDLTITPEAVVQLIFDPKVGDKMTGSGSGDLNITLNKKGDFRISGDYTVDKGDYLFTLRNILNKKFDVEKGGKIMFSGKLDDAEIDLKAIYQKFSTSLQPLFPDDPKGTERISVEPQLLLSGKLFNPVVGFEINLPSADEATRAYVRNAISTEEEMSRQFLYLLVTNSFYSDNGSTAPTSTSGTSAMAVTTTEMISNQISNWISQITKDFDLGFVYRPGSKDINSTELQVALSTQVLNDKVAINGNFDYVGTSPTGNTDQITGDFDAEIKITEKIRFKVFNRFNDISLGKGPYTQGVGIFFKEDFNKFSDLFRKKAKADMKKQDEVTVKEQ